VNLAQPERVLKANTFTGRTQSQYDIYLCWGG